MRAIALALLSAVALAHSGYLEVMHQPIPSGIFGFAGGACFSAALIMVITGK